VDYFFLSILPCFCHPPPDWIDFSWQVFPGIFVVVYDSSNVISDVSCHSWCVSDNGGG
jgi:hypothetical protein